MINEKRARPLGFSTFTIQLLLLSRICTRNLNFVISSRYWFFKNNAVIPPRIPLETEFLCYFEQAIVARKICAQQIRSRVLSSFAHSFQQGSGRSTQKSEFAMKILTIMLRLG